jgi:hypothetical protein
MRIDGRRPGARIRVRVLHIFSTGGDDSGEQVHHGLWFALPCLSQSQSKTHKDLNQLPSGLQYVSLLLRLRAPAASHVINETSESRFRIKGR